MPKYWVKNYFAWHTQAAWAKILGKIYFSHGSFPEVGQKQKAGEKRRERLNDGNNNASTHGTRKPPGPIETLLEELNKKKEGKRKEQAGLSRATLEINYWPLL